MEKDYADPANLPDHVQQRFKQTPIYVFDNPEDYGPAQIEGANSIAIAGGRGGARDDFWRAVQKNLGSDKPYPIAIIDSVDWSPGFLQDGKLENSGRAIAERLSDFIEGKSTLRDPDFLPALDYQFYLANEGLFRERVGDFILEAAE